MSEVFNRYVGQHVQVVSGAGQTSFGADGELRACEGQWLVIDNAESGRAFVRRDLAFWIVADPPEIAHATLPRPAGRES